MRRLSAEEEALWRRVVDSVRPLHGGLAPVAAPEAPVVKARAAVAAAPTRQAVPGTTLDASWDRRLARGLVAPDRTLDLHRPQSRHPPTICSTARLEAAVATGARLLLLITRQAAGGSRAARRDPGGDRRLARRLPPRRRDRGGARCPPPPWRFRRALHCPQAEALSE